MHHIAEVFVNIPVKTVAKAYTYLIPPEFEHITPGWRVIVPFGSRRLEGFVVNVSTIDDTDGLKLIESLVDDQPWFDDKLLQLTKKMADYYLCSPGETMRLFMPGKSGVKITGYYYAKFDNEAMMFSQLDDTITELYDYILENQPQTKKQLERRFATHNIVRQLKSLLDSGLVWLETTARPSSKVKYEKIIIARPELAKFDFKRRPAQKRAAELLSAQNEVSAAELQKSKITPPIIKSMLKDKLIDVSYRRIYRDTYDGYKGDCLKEQMAGEQLTAFHAIATAAEQRKNTKFLLHGITGSGKTQVYIESVATVRKNGRQAIVLVPEIALTSQIVKRFKAYFDNDVIVLHSKLSVSERNDAVSRLRSGLAGIVIGARSAMFVPIHDVGIIIMDEEHDGAYKQDESPRYHTRDMAIMMAEIYGAVLILGSATPSIETYYKALNGEYQLLTLHERFDGAVLPEVQLVDMREELKAGRRNVLSRPLHNLIQDTVEKGEQLILLLNRRGFSTFVMCRSCGHVVSCPECTLPLTYHADGRLLCHFCDTAYPVPDICPACGSRYIKYFGTGTERLEYELGKQFPGLKIARMDRDTMGSKKSHIQLLDDFAAGRYDILLGTQMVAKGHDVKNVTGVGIISADTGLNLPDFRAAERCFALLTQAAGRAGRGNIRGHVVVQTYNPDHYAVAAASQHDYEGFYRQEIELRRSLNYPPYCELIKLLVQSVDEQAALFRAEALADDLIKLSDGSFIVTGPFEPSIPQLRGVWRRGILLKVKDSQAVRQALCQLKINLAKDVSIDINPLNVM